MDFMVDRIKVVVDPDTVFYIKCFLRRLSCLHCWTFAASFTELHFHSYQFYPLQWKGQYRHVSKHACHQNVKCLFE